MVRLHDQRHFLSLNLLRRRNFFFLVGITPVCSSPHRPEVVDDFLLAVRTPFSPLAGHIQSLPTGLFLEPRSLHTHPHGFFSTNLLFTPPLYFFFFPYLFPPTNK